MAVERSHAQVGDSVILRAEFTQANTLADPSDISQVLILDASFATVATIAAAAVVQDAVGKYHVEWGVPAAGPTGQYYDRWFATPSDGAVEKEFTHSFYVSVFASAAATTPYMTTAELKEYLPDATGLSDAQVAAMGLMAQEVAEAVAGGHKFLPVDEARVFDGLGRPVQPFDIPIIRGSITAIEFLRDDGWEDVTPANSQDIRYMKSRLMVGIGNVRSRSQRSRSACERWGCLTTSSITGCGIFPIGLQNVRITASWGRWEEVPLHVKHAIGLLVSKAGRCDNPQGAMSNPYEAESVGTDRAFTWRDILVDAKTKRTTGFGDVDALLKRVPRVPRVIAVV